MPEFIWLRSWVRQLIIPALLLAVTGSPSSAAFDLGKKANSGSGKKHLLLFAKNPSTWVIVKNSGSGRLVYREATGNFTLNAKGLHPRSSYALVRYSDAPPKGDILARGSSDEHGNLELRGIWKNWTKKFWVVAGEDLAGNVGETASLKAWRPDRYLFEEKQLGIACDCPEPEEP